MCLGTSTQTRWSCGVFSVLIRLAISLAAGVAAEVVDKAAGLAVAAAAVAGLVWL